jgi:2-polyprenyl-3-methyl-5-hydroxy-6-metoxy-1,4-benzoquinol methylase
MAENGVSATAFFSEQAERWTDLYARKASFSDRLALIVEGVQRTVQPGGSVLDVGCGAGNVSFALAEQGYDVTGIDGAAEMIRIARAEAQRRGLSRVHFREADLSRLDVADRSCDAVVCSSVIEYIEDDAALLREMHAALRPAGCMLVSVPHAASLVGAVEDALWRVRVGGERDGRQHLRYSLRRYRRRDFLAQLRAIGFGAFRCTYFELPLLGRLGVGLSRLPALGVMLLVETARTSE